MRALSLVVFFKPLPMAVLLPQMVAFQFVDEVVKVLAKEEGCEDRGWSAAVMAVPGPKLPKRFFV